MLPEMVDEKYYFKLVLNILGSWMWIPMFSSWCQVFIFLYSQYYRKTASHPYTTVMAEELFQADLLPSITDYGNFVKYGNIPGKC
jgi:hypothetical protein